LFITNYFILLLHLIVS